MQGTKKHIQEGRGAEFLVGQLSLDGALDIEAMRHNAIDVTGAQLRDVELVTSTIGCPLEGQKALVSCGDDSRNQLLLSQHSYTIYYLLQKCLIMRRGG
jgi:hypothetical protein